MGKKCANVKLSKSGSIPACTTYLRPMQNTVAKGVMTLRDLGKELPHNASSMIGWSCQYQFLVPLESRPKVTTPASTRMPACDVPN